MPTAAHLCYSDNISYPHSSRICEQGRHRNQFMRYFTGITLLMFSLAFAPVASAAEKPLAGEASEKSASAGKAAASEKPADESRKEIVRLLKDLDSNRYETRRVAAERFEQLMKQPEQKQLLADEFQRVLVQADTSFEVRWRLERWVRLLPEGRLDSPDEVSGEEVNRLVNQLSENNYGARIGASRRLEWLLGNPRMAGAILLRLKQQLSDPSLDVETRLQAETLWQRARKAWLAGDVSDLGLPPISDEEIERWLDTLSRPANDGNRAAIDLAEQELLDALIRDDQVPKLAKRIAARLAAGIAGEPAERLNALLNWTKPEIAFETWAGGHLRSSQRMLVGVDTKSRGATQTFLFDRIDDVSAHCVKGNMIRPGDYPVGIAIPHPATSMKQYFFHIVNLPTPRRRMAYASGDESKRLAEVSRRTLDKFLTAKKPLTLRECEILESLDPVEASRFAAKFFFVVEDSAMKSGSSYTRARQARTGGQLSQFGWICRFLASKGTKEAAPGLLEAIDKKRFIEADSSRPCAMHWLAALSIAARDPWPGAEAWLADCMNRSQSLVLDATPSPQLNATAAAILMRRRNAKPDDFGLASATTPFLATVNIDGYYYANAKAKQKAAEWWAANKDKKPSPKPENQDPSAEKDALRKAVKKLQRSEEPNNPFDD